MSRRKSGVRGEEIVCAGAGAGPAEGQRSSEPRVASAGGTRRGQMVEGAVKERKSRGSGRGRG